MATHMTRIKGNKFTIAALIAATTFVPIAAFASGGGGGSGGSGGGTTTPPATCVTTISSFSNTAGYGPYGPNVADIKSRFTVKNCTSTPLTLTGRVTYVGPFWGGSTFAFPLSCNMAIAPNSSQTCQITERYLMIRQTYGVTLDVLDTNGAVIATANANVDTPTVPNPLATPGS